MAITHEDALMAPGNWDVDLDHTPDVYDKLTFVHEGKRRPRRELHALIKRKSDNALMAPPLPLFRVGGGREGLSIGGRGPLWHLGADIGPLIRDREYVSGANKLSNGNFALLGDFWQRPSEGSLWTFSVGFASCAGGLDRDDVLGYDLQLPTRPGHSYRAQASTVGDRVRILFEGEFNPSNILPDAGFGGGGWSTTPNISIVDGVMRVGAIPKPQLVINPMLVNGTGWTTEPTIGILPAPLDAYGGATWVMALGPNIQPQLLLNPTFDDGPGYPWAVPESGDIAFLNDASKARSSPWVIKVGPNRQKQLIINPTFDVDLSGWFMNSEVASPEPGLFYWHPTDGLADTGGATTDGTAFPRAFKYLRADPVAGGGVEEFDVVAGEQWQFEAFVRRSPTADGYAYLSLAIPHPDDIPKGMRWYLSPHADERSDRDGEKRLRLETTVVIPANRFHMNALLEVHDHTVGFWSFDEARLTRIRGNRDTMLSVPYPLEPHSSYRLQANVNSGNDHQVGNAIIGIILTHGTEADQRHSTSQGHTDFTWTRMQVDFSPDDGYTSGTPFIGAEDIFGEPIYVDDFQLIKTSNNSAEATGTPFAVVPDQRYLLNVPVRSDGDVTRGTVTVGVRLRGPGLADEIVTVDQGSTNNEWLMASTEVRPGPGYTEAVPFVRSTDIEGGWCYVGKFEVIKMDNNTETSVGAIFSVTPERSYHWEETVLSGGNLQRGTVTLSARCMRAGYPDVTFDSSPMEGTGGEVKRMTFDFTPPSGYDLVEPRIIATDVEGPGEALWTIDHGDLRDTDKSTVVFDSAPGSALVDATAPAGAQFVRVLLVVEQGSGPWTVTSVSLARTGVTPATGNAILAQLLTDPTTGAPLSIAPGVLSCPEVIPYDWPLLNMTARDALEHYCGVVSEPPREFHITPTLPPALNVGAAETVFTDHGPDSPFPITLLERDRDVEDIEDVELDAEDRPTEIEVIGAVRKTVSGQDILITATAQVPGPVEYDLNNRPIRRTKVVSEGTVDHFGYAQALAADLATKEARPPLSVTVKLSGHERECPPGDWIYAYDPQAGLEDAGNGHSIEGEWVSPRRERVLSNTRQFGSAYKVVMREPNGTEWDLPGVRESDEDSTTLVIGDRLTPWEADPQGGSEGQQYLRDRKSGPR